MESRKQSFELPTTSSSPGGVQRQRKRACRSGSFARFQSEKTRFNQGLQQSLEATGAKDTNEKEHRKFTKALLSLEPEGSEEEAFSRALWHNHKKKPKALMDGLEESLEDSSSEENECDSEEMPEGDQFLAELEGQASSSKPQKPDKATKAEEKKRKQEAREHEKKKREEEKQKAKEEQATKRRKKIEQQEEKWQQEVEQASNCPDNKMAVSLRKMNSLLAVELKTTQEAMKQQWLER